jgi:REP element-mobilizing transposase RayT
LYVYKIQSYRCWRGLFYNDHNSWVGRCFYEIKTALYFNRFFKILSKRERFRNLRILYSHIHLLCKGSESETLASIIRDFKKFTSKKIIQTIIEFPESRREWLLAYFKEACAHLKRTQQYKVWQDGYHAEHVYSNKFIKQKLNYIHQNPVVHKIVSAAEDYVFSSAKNYAELDNELEIIRVDIF